MKKIVLMVLAILIAASSLAMADAYTDCTVGKKNPECPTGNPSCCAAKSE
jgi:hypothetical protein